MNPLETDLAERLAALREQNLHRELRRVDSAQSSRVQIAGNSFLNFSSNDYLGLANHPALKEAARRAIEIPNPLSLQRLNRHQGSNFKHPTPQLPNSSCFP